MPDMSGLKRGRETSSLVQQAKIEAQEALRLLSETPERKQPKYFVESPGVDPSFAARQRGPFPD